MRKHAVLFFVIILISSCAAPVSMPVPTQTQAPMPTSALKPTAAPTVAPTIPPQPTRTPMGSLAAATASRPTAASATKAPSSQPTRPGISLQNLKPEKQADGSVRTTANVTAAESLGVGQMDLSAPEKMLLTDTRSVRLRVSASQQLAALTPVAQLPKTPDLPSFVYKFAGNIEMYPVMFAELSGLNFDIDKKGRIRHDIVVGKTVEWVWIVKPLALGTHELSLELSIPATVGGVASEMNTNVIHNLPIVVQVVEPPVTPTPTPMPRSAIDRMVDSMVENTGAILAALIGVVGSILGGVFALVTRRRAKSN